MPTDCISYQDSGYFSTLINDYLGQEPDLRPLYNRFPTLESFEMQIAEKKSNFNNNYRETLVSVLQKQYRDIEIPLLTKENIESLAHGNTFTITTGHQLNLFTGPLYFLYKIISTINLTKQLKSKYPAYHFVPVYWMASEDHDFEEINFFNFKGKKIRWNHESSGPVGRLSTKDLKEVFKTFSSESGIGNNAEEMKQLFYQAYLKHNNLADATRYLANALFGDYGLVILDADNVDLKREFIPFVKQELQNQVCYKNVVETSKKLKNYFVQVNPRKINLFYLEDNLRERIVLEDNIYRINNTGITFTEEAILSELEKNPDKFSPNVIMRPLYQEVILPNLCYIGGGGEIAYWLELKSFFNVVGVSFPILLLRNSVLLATEKQAKKADKLGLDWADLFLEQTALINKKIKALSEFPIDFSAQKEFLKKQFENLHSIAAQTDKSFSGAVKAQEMKQIKGLEHLEKRLLKAQKRKYSNELERLKDFQNELFPLKDLQERQANFSEFYIDNGKLLIEKLLAELEPLKNEFKVLVFKP